jgi:hypothetical protein
MNNDSPLPSFYCSIIGKTQQQYADSQTGLQKMGLERSKGDRARKMVRERCNGKETTNDTLKNIKEDETEAFDNEWNQSAMQSGFSTGRGNHHRGIAADSYQQRGSQRRGNMAVPFGARAAPQRGLPMSQQAPLSARSSRSGSDSSYNTGGLALDSSREHGQQQSQRGSGSSARSSRSNSRSSLHSVRSNSRAV